MKKVGFIGMGIMGVRMASNLQKGGYQITVHNRTQHKAAALVDKGAIWAASPKEMAQGNKLIITMLSTPEVIRTLALGKDGFLEQMKKDSLWLNCSLLTLLSQER